MNSIAVTTNKISIVIPCLNEQGNVPIIFAKIREILPNAEVIFVDDGSSDQTWSVLSELVKVNRNLKALRFTRNFGHQAALEAGIRLAEGDAIVTIDCDLQHPVELIPRMIEIWKSGKLIVNTCRKDTEGVGFLKKLFSKIFYKFFNIISDVKLTNASSDFRLLDKKVALFLNNLEQRTKFYRGLIPWSGFSFETIEYQAAARVNGQSSYSIAKMFELARVGITFFSYLPLKLIVVFGMIISISSVTLFLITLISKFLYPNLFSSAALFGSFILANSGLIIIVLGILALYQVNLFRELQGLPPYIIVETASSAEKSEQ